MKSYLSIQEAAENLGVEYKTVYRLVKQGEIPAGKIGRVFRIRREDLDAYFERQKAKVLNEAVEAGESRVGSSKHTANEYDRGDRDGFDQNEDTVRF